MFIKHDMTLNRVHDVVRIREGGESITLRVDADPMRLVAGLSQAQKAMMAVKDDAPEGQRREAVMYFATVIFGKDQAAKLFEFYNDTSDCVALICSQYFADRLIKLINKAQKKAK